MSISSKPRLIALCGNPGSGKSEAQRQLKEWWGYSPVDDGYPLRDFAMRHLGFTHDQVYTQAGKLEMMDVAGEQRQVRDVLGQLGNAIEEKFGRWAIPHMALQQANALGRRYSFGSVRRDQGAFYKKHGGVILEIVNPDAGPSAYEFDRYDASLADYRIMNDGLSLGMGVEDAREDLRQKLERFFLSNERRIVASC